MTARTTRPRRLHNKYLWSSLPAFLLLLAQFWYSLTTPTTTISSGRSHTTDETARILFLPVLSTTDASTTTASASNKEVDSDVSSLSATTTRQSPSPPQSSQRSETIVDILSVGSISRTDLLEAQRQTMGAHPAVRHFYQATETTDDPDPHCHDTNLSRNDVKAIVDFCYWPENELQPVGAGSVLAKCRRGYAKWHRFLKNKPNPAGWMCAQKRAGHALAHLSSSAAYHNNNNNNTNKNSTALPDYLFLVDDDTLMDVTAIIRTLQLSYPASEPLAMAGCLIRSSLENEHFTLPWGGFGTVLSRTSLQRLLTPLTCSNENNNNNNGHSAFVQEACRQLDRNLFYEKQYFTEGMSLVDLMNDVFIEQTPYTGYKNWTRETNYCVHSDWLWGYFFNYYPIGQHSGEPRTANVPEARMTSYRRSEFFTGRKKDAQTRMALDGQCRNGQSYEKTCPVNAHICHYVSPEQMVNLTLARGQPVDKLALSAKDELAALWVKETVPLEIVNKEPSPPTYSDNDPLDVFFYPNLNHTLTHEVKHFLLNGLNRSSALQTSSDYRTAPLWIVDALRAGLHSKSFCTRLVKLVRERLAENPHGFWRLALLHWEDDATNTDFLDCFRLVRLMGPERVVRFKRSTVRDRYWNDTTRFIESGQVIHYGNWKEYAGAPVQQLNYGVRSDMFDEIQRLSLEQSNAQSVAQRERHTDVSHFWPLPGRDDSLVGRGKASKLRDMVSEALNKIVDSNIFIGIAGKAQDEGRNTVQTAYLEKMLDSKIVVVSQKDRWEDHYRLMEALISGAMVMSDPMLTLPHGLRDGESIVIYRSMTDLQEKIDKYLASTEERIQIANAGYNIAVTHHQSWHMMERVASVSLAVVNDY